MSYFNCIELEGREEDILEGLNVLFSPSNLHLTPKAKMYLNGQFEGQCLVYKPKTNECLTPISFMWKPTIIDQRRQLWLWCHPASYDALGEILLSLFDPSSSSISMDEPPIKKAKNGDENSSTVNVRLLRDQQEFARFRLIGPLAMAVLKHALHPSELPSDTVSERPAAPRAWWLPNAHPSDLHQQQLQFWSSQLGNTSTMMPNRIVSLVVRDPRIFTPIKPKLTIHSKTSKFYSIKSIQNL